MNCPINVRLLNTFSVQSKCLMFNLEGGLKNGSGSVIDFGRKLEYLNNLEAL